MERERTRVFVTGATGFLGFRVVASLLDQGMAVTALVRPDQLDKLAVLEGRIRIVQGDIWNRGSLKGLARGHQIVVHLVGSVRADPARGLTYQQINLVSARNIIGMAVSDGVPNFVFLSVASPPMMMPADYIFSKRDAEDYLQNSGLHWTIVRPPVLYLPALRRPLLSLMGALGGLPPLSWLIGRYMPLSVELAGRGIAALCEDVYQYEMRTIYANRLRRLARQRSTGKMLTQPVIASRNTQDDALDETPFAWLPPPPTRRRYDE